MRRLTAALAALTLTACTPELEALRQWVLARQTEAVVAGEPCWAYADDVVWRGLPPHFIGVMWRESRCDPFAVSPDGARGLLQIMPFWLRDLCPRLIACSIEDLYDPAKNIDAAAYVFAVQGPSAWSQTW